jgi:hypothetical protein
VAKQAHKCMSCNKRGFVHALPRDRRFCSGGARQGPRDAGHERTAIDSAARPRRVDHGAGAAMTRALHADSCRGPAALVEQAVCVPEKGVDCSATAGWGTLAAVALGCYHRGMELSLLMRASICCTGGVPCGAISFGPRARDRYICHMRR